MNLAKQIASISFVADQARFSDTPFHDTALVDAANDIRVEFQALTYYIRQILQQLTQDSKTHGADLDTTIRMLRNEIKDLVDSLSRNFGVFEHKLLELSEVSKPYEISLVDKLLIYQQVSNEYIHNITTPLASIESAIGNIQGRLPLILQTSDALPTEAASILISSLENALFSIDSIKSILRQGAGFLADNAKRFSVEGLIHKATRMVMTAVPNREFPAVKLSDLPDVKYDAIAKVGSSALPVLRTQFYKISLQRSAIKAN